LADCVIWPGRALVRTTEALETIEPSAWFERTIARLLVTAYKRRLRAIIGAAPPDVGDAILVASGRTAEGGVMLHGKN
jgi:hypothetical protein